MHQPKATVLFEREGNIAIITLNRPAHYNGLNNALMKELLHILDSISEDDSIRAVVLTGAGAGFCAGGDLQKVKVLSKDERISPPFGAKDFVPKRGIF